MLYPIPSYWSVSCSIGFLSVSCCFLASLLKGGFRPIQVILTPGSAWHKCLYHLYHYSVSECVNVWCISCRLSFKIAKTPEQGPYRGRWCLSQRVRVENGACTSGLLGFLDLVHLRGASLHANVVEEFGATLEEVATFLKPEGKTSHPAQFVQRIGVRRLRPL